MKIDLPPLQPDTAELSADGMDRRLLVLVLGGILCLGMALGLELFPHITGRDLRTVMLAPSIGGGQEPMILPEPTVPAQELSFAQLLQILSPRRADPAATGFLRAFFANPRLKRLYEDFQKNSSDRPAAEFVALLQRSPDFGDLMRSYSKQADFRGLAATLTRHPGLNRLLRALRAPAPAALGPVPRSAPSDRGADTLGAEARGRSSPVGAIKAPGSPVSSERQR